MKCKYCGANLEIDTEYCPFCGKQNPIAGKHREDMKRFEKDYRDTKAEVIGNSKRFNRRTFRITAVAVTIAMIAILIVVAVQTEKLSYSIYREKQQKESVKHIDEIRDLMLAGDCIAFNDFVKQHGIRFYGDKELSRYSYVSHISSNYADIFNYAMKANFSDEYSKYAASTICNEIRGIYSYSEEIAQDGDPDKIAYCDKVKRDLKLLLVTYLSISPEDAETIGDLSEGSLLVLIEEGYNETIGK